MKKRHKKPLNPFFRDQLVLRQGPGCISCGLQIDPYELTIDHNIPRCRGGSDALENLSLMCERCNGEKGALTMWEWFKAGKPNRQRPKPNSEPFIWWPNRLPKAPE